MVRPKSKAAAMSRGFNSIQNRPIYYSSPFKRGVCTKVTTMTPRKPNLLFVKSRVCASRMASRSLHIFPEKDTSFKSTPWLLFGGRVKDVGLRYTVVRGRLDAAGVDKRKQGRSLYGAKNPGKKD